MTDYAKMTLPELKAEAKGKIKGFSTMKKADLVSALSELNKPTEAQPSFVEAIVANIRNTREARSNKGRAASKYSDSPSKNLPEDKATAYKMQRGSSTAKLTAKQVRRIRKATNQLAG